MKFRILTILIFIFSLSFSQEKIEIQNVYFENGIALNNSNNQIFTGTAQNKDKKGHISFEEIYENEKLIKTLLYYNYNIKDEQIVSTETFYNPKTNKKNKTLKYSSDGKNMWESKFDENEKESEFNFYENGKLTQHKEYFQGKRNGKWFCIEKDGSKSECEYLNGKKIKDCR